MAQANSHVGSSRHERAVQLGRHVAVVRSSVLGSVRAAYDKTNISRNTWAEVERGSQSPRSDTYARVERALGWPTGSCLAYLDAGADLPVGHQEDTPSGALQTRSLDDMPHWIRSEFTTYGVTDPLEQARRLQEIVYDYVQDAKVDGHSPK